MFVRIVVKWKEPSHSLIKLIAIIMKKLFFFFGGVHIRIPIAIDNTYEKETKPITTPSILPKREISRSYIEEFPKTIRGTINIQKTLPQQNIQICTDDDLQTTEIDQTIAVNDVSFPIIKPLITVPVFNLNTPKESLTLHSIQRMTPVISAIPQIPVTPKTTVNLGIPQILKQIIPLIP